MIDGAAVDAGAALESATPLVGVFLHDAAAAAKRTAAATKSAGARVIEVDDSMIRLGSCDAG
jgi:hypothetical protein